MSDNVSIHWQVPVLVTIVGVDERSEVYYTYSDPGTGIHYDKSRTCIINAVSPFQTLFALDYATSRNGWTIKKRAERKPGIAQATSPLIPSSPDKETHDLVLITRDYDDQEYKFDLIFYNYLSTKTTWDDPQEGNVLQPIKPRDAGTNQAS